jgi:propionyl-CoA carboxylase alpha chain
LIANRGEIACRIMRTAKKLGIKTVAVYSEADVRAKFVRMADEAVCVGPPPTKQSYLNMEAILDAAKKTKAQAVHPGFGFLSENPTFAELLTNNGIVFIGPTYQAMRAMSDKIESKKLAKSAGVNIIPGKLADVRNVEEALALAHEIGYPVMLKASAGGGGKGMRIAWNDQEARDGYRLAKQEAASSFVSDRLLVEKYIDQPRHIEIQVLGDSYGNVIFLNERECSIQRRNQKILEESPSPFLDPKTRNAMGSQAVMLAKAVKYQSAGTVEFLVDKKKNFYFLEMNTRLQVEHPVTEYVTGLDLVEEMIRIAAGGKLKWTQEEVPIKGWAMEARVYAEDPTRNFLPSIGTLQEYIEPVPGKDAEIRVDSGILDGDEISIYYDPMIAKVIGHGSTRKEAINELTKALDCYVIKGVNHNIPFLRTVLEHPRYLAGDITTKFIPEEFPEGFKEITLSPTQLNQLLASAAVMQVMREERDVTINDKLPSFSLPTTIDLVLTFHNVQYPVTVERVSEFKDYKVNVNNSVSILSVDWPIDGRLFKAKINGVDATLQMVDVLPRGYRIQHIGNKFVVTVETPLEAELHHFMPKKEKIDMSKFILTPMPGRITSVAVKAGDKLVIGQEVCVIEAMKMQNIIRSTSDAIVKQFHGQVGDNVAVDQILVEFD